MGEVRTAIYALSHEKAWGIIGWAYIPDWPPEPGPDGRYPRVWGVRVVPPLPAVLPGAGALPMDEAVPVTEICFRVVWRAGSGWPAEPALGVDADDIPRLSLLPGWRPERHTFSPPKEPAHE